MDQNLAGTRSLDHNQNVIGRIEEMEDILHPVCNSNILVFFDIAIDWEYVGRMIIELRNDIVPRTSENFRSLCTGERGLGGFGRPLHYKGTQFFKVTSNYVCGGDVVNNDGTGGDTIYGNIFADEGHLFKHEAGVLSSGNYGVSNSNNSQFILTSEPAPELDATYHVVFGRILRGLPILFEMETVTVDTIPKEKIFILNCGELKTTDDWGFCDRDWPFDTLPPYPRDWELKLINFPLHEKLKILNDIQITGDNYYRAHKFIKALQKYKKTMRYYNFFMTRGQWDKYRYFALAETELPSMYEFASLHYCKMAAVELRLEKFQSAVYYCSETIYLGRHCSKAYYRRGQANYCLRRYADAIRDFSMSKHLNPNNKHIHNEIIRAKNRLDAYETAETIRLERLGSMTEEQELDLDLTINTTNNPDPMWCVTMPSPTESMD